MQDCFKFLHPRRSPPAFRCCSIGVATIWLFFLLLRKSLRTRGRPPRAALLLATDTIFLLTDVFDWGPVALAHLLLLGGMLLLYRYYETRQAFGCGWGFFLFGLAMWDKAHLHMDADRPGDRLAGGISARPCVGWPRPKPLAVAAVAFLLGAAAAGEVQLWTKGRLSAATPPGRRTDFSGKLEMATARCRAATCSATWFGKTTTERLPAAARRPLARASEAVERRFGHPRQNLMLAALAGALLLLPLLWRARTRGAAYHPFRAGISLTAWLAMALNPGTGGSVHHIVLLWPFPHMVVAVAFGEAAQKFGRPGKAALAVMLVLICALQPAGDQRVLPADAAQRRPGWSGPMPSTRCPTSWEARPPPR